MIDLPQLQPLDEHDQTLLGNVHPPDWTQPEPSGRYNLIVLGGGTAGLVAAAGAAGLGAKVALVERKLLGGDCLNVGCVPSKAIIRAARAAWDVRDAHRYGVRVPEEVEVDFPAVMERMRRLRARISPHDSAARFRDLGIDVYLGAGRFTGPETLEVAGRTLRFARGVVATGARAHQPSVPGMDEASFLTNETVFSLTRRPRSMAVIGAGPIGAELAQAFQRLGVQVTLVHKHDHILSREDPEAADILQRAFRREGIELVLGCRIQRVESGEGGHRLHLVCGDRESVLEVEEILIGAGRVPNVEGIGLEAAGVAFDPRRGVEVDDRLRSTNPRIYAAGDAAMRYKFTHAADAAARIVIQNALFWGRSKLSALTIPWVTYTDPEIAHVGMYEPEARQAGIPTQEIRIPLEAVDRAVTDGEEEGFLKVLLPRGKDRILGATLVARNAGDMISEITTAMVGGMGLRSLSGVIHPYPTQAEVVKRAADAYNRTRLTPGMKRLFGSIMRWRRREGSRG